MDVVELAKTKADSLNSWTVNVADVNAKTCDLSVKNPNAKKEAPLREPKEILVEIAKLDEECANILKSIKGLL